MEIKQFNYLPEHAHELRKEVFIKEQGFAAEFDETDNIAIHFVAYDDDDVIGTCRIFTENDPQVYHIGRMAVRKTYRHQHVGAALLRAAEQFIRANDGVKITLSAQEHAIPFYRKQGFVQEGDIYMDEHCPHLRMNKNLK